MYNIQSQSWKYKIDAASLSAPLITIIVHRKHNNIQIKGSQQPVSLGLALVGSALYHSTLCSLLLLLIWCRVVITMPVSTVYVNVINHLTALH